MKKIVLKLDVCNDKCRRKAMKTVSGFDGVQSISMDMQDRKLTLTGDVDPVSVVRKLRKTYSTDIESVGPAK